MDFFIGIRVRNFNGVIKKIDKNIKGWFWFEKCIDLSIIFCKLDFYDMCLNL